MILVEACAQGRAPGEPGGDLLLWPQSVSPVPCRTMTSTPVTSRRTTVGGRREGRVYHHTEPLAGRRGDEGRTMGGHQLEELPSRSRGWAPPIPGGMRAWDETILEGGVQGLGVQGVGGMALDGKWTWKGLSRGTHPRAPQGQDRPSDGRDIISAGG